MIKVKVIATSINLFSVVFCALLFAIVLYLQHFENIKPCLLCELQRYAYGLVILFAFISFAHNPRALWRRVYAILGFLSAVLGLLFSGRQIWLQHQPPGTVTGCLPNFNYLIGHVPVTKAISLAFHGTGDCAQVKWSLLSLSMASWSFLCFGLLAVLMAVIVLLKARD